MLVARLNHADESLLKQICAEKWAETDTLEFKQILPKPGDEGAKHEFLKDVSALANSNGGDMVYGISEKAGVANAVLTLIEPFDATCRRLGQMLDSGIEPRIPGIQYKEVAVSGGYVLVLRVPASFDGPHRCIVERRFVMRTGSRTNDMSYDQLRNAFDRTATLLQMARKFREERIAELIRRSTWKGLRSGPVCVLHLIPMSSMAGRQQVDVQELNKDTRPFSMESWHSGLTSSFNIDGLLMRPAYGDEIPAYAFTQIYRSGAMETAMYGGSLAQPSEDTRKLIPSTVVTKFYREAIEKLLFGAIHLGISGPAILGLSLLHVEGYQLAVGNVFNLLNRTFVDREHLTLPEVWIPDLSDTGSVDEVARPMLDVVWQAFSVERCFEFDPSGKWAPRGYL